MLHLPFQVHRIVGDVQHQLYIGARQHHLLGRNQAAHLRQVLQGGFLATVAPPLQQFRHSNDRQALEDSAIAFIAHDVPPARSAVPEYGVIDVAHVAQFALKHSAFRFDALQPDLPAQLRVRIANPHHAAKRLVPAALNGNDFPRILHAAQAANPCSVRRNIIRAGHLKTRLLVLVPVGDANRQSHVDSLVGAFRPRLRQFHLRRLFGSVLHKSIGGKKPSVQTASRKTVAAPPKEGQFTLVTGTPGYFRPALGLPGAQAKSVTFS